MILKRMLMMNGNDDEEEDDDSMSATTNRKCCNHTFTAPCLVALRMLLQLTYSSFDNQCEY